MMNHGGVLNAVLGGWQLNGILTIQNGQPFSPVLQTSTTNGTGSRPDIIKPVTYPRTLQRWFDPSAFATPAALYLWQRRSQQPVRTRPHQLGCIAFQGICLW